MGKNKKNTQDKGMKAIKEHVQTTIQSDLINVYESNGLQYVIPTVDEAINMLKSINGFGKYGGTRKKPGFFITEEYIRALYDWRDKHKLSCPIVGNYGHNKGQFVFRHWVGELHMLEIDTNHKEYDDEMVTFTDEYFLDCTSGKYKGLHDTKCREDNAYFPSATDVETIIVMLYNIVNAVDKTFDEVAKDVTGVDVLPNTKQEQILNYVIMLLNTVLNENVTEDEKLDFAKGVLANRGYISGIPNNIKQLKRFIEKSEPTSHFKSLGNYQRNQKVAQKTDIVSDDGKYRISVKKGNDASQLMSGGERESLAVLMSALNYVGDKTGNLKLVIDEIYNNYPKPDNGKITDTESEQRIKRIADCNKILTNLFENRKAYIDGEEIVFDKNIIDEFKRQIMLEAASGRCKFGNPDRPIDDDSQPTGVANYVYVCHSDLKSKLYTVEDFVREYINKTKFVFGHKSNSGKSDRFVALRIPVKPK